MAAPTKTEPQTADYSNLIAMLEGKLAEAKADALHARDDGIKYNAENRIAELERGIALAKRAQAIPAHLEDGRWVADEPVQFGFETRSGIVPMAPNLAEFANEFPPIRFRDFAVIATYPLHIATLDAAAESGRCKRVPYKYQYAVPANGVPGGMWVPFDTWKQLIAQGMARG